jgi:hypothetical protein
MIYMHIEPSSCLLDCRVREHTKGRQPACSCGIVRNRRCRIPVRQRISFLSIPYVCPEPVLVD